MTKPGNCPACNRWECICKVGAGICGQCRRATCICGMKPLSHRLNKEGRLDRLVTDVLAIKTRVQAAPEETLERAMYEADLRRAETALQKEMLS